MKAPTREQTLAAFVSRNPERPGLASPFVATYDRFGRSFAVHVATDGHSLAACVDGPEAGLLTTDQLIELVTAEPANAAKLRAAGRPPYWLALAKRTGKPARAIGLDAELFARIDLAQARVLGVSLARSLEQARSPSERKELRAMYAVLHGVSEIRPAGELEPLCWAVVPPLRGQHCRDEAWVGAIMPCRLGAA